VSAAPAVLAGDSTGGLAFGLGVIFIGAFALAWVGMFAALKLQRVRGRPRTRTAIWLGAVIAATLAFGAFYIYGFTRMPAGSLSRIPEQVRTARDTMDVKLPPVLERMAGGKERLKAQQEMTKGMLDSPAFIWWSVVVGTTMMCVVFGTLVGSLAFGGAMIAGRIVQGHWPLRAIESRAADEHQY